MAQNLAGLRSQRERAVNAAADVGVKQALANVDRSRLGELGGTSSYDKRLAIGAVTPIRTQAALDTANQSRADLGYVTQNQLGLIGQRGQLQNALAGYGLQPYNVAAGMQSHDLQNLQGITNLDQANTFYGLKQQRNPWANAADALDAGVMNGLAAYSSVGGGMARGGLVDFSRGGMARGPGTGHSDSIPINVSNGEFIVPASAVRMPGVLPMLQRIRAAGLARERYTNPMEQEIRMNDAGGWRTPHTQYARGGLVRIGYDEGGFVGGGDGWAMGNAEGYDSGGFYGNDYGGYGGGQPQRQQQQKSSAGGGGLAGSAQQLIAREQASLTPTWQQATIIPTGGGGWGMPQTSTGTTRNSMPSAPAGAMPRSSFNTAQFMSSLYGPEAVPSNFDELHPDQQQQYFEAYQNARKIEREHPQNFE